MVVIAVGLALALTPVADPRAPPPPQAVSADPDAEPPAVRTPAAPAPVLPEDAEAKKAPARLRGRVLTFGDRQPIPGARIIPTDGRPTVETGDDGSFSIDTTAGAHKFIIRAAGFVDLESTVNLGPRQDLELEYRLEPTLDGRTYRTVVTQRREVAVSSTTLRDDEIYKVPGARGDPLRVIQNLPGVAQLAGFLPYVIVRGAAPGNTGYYLDGTRVPILFHVAIGPSVIHPYFIDAVDFYPSGAPVRLGRYVSGIIEARTKPGRRDRVHGEVDVRLTDAGALLEIPVGRKILPGCLELKRRKCKRGPGSGSLTLAGRYSYTALILSAVQSTARIQYWDYQGRFDHRVGPRANFTAFAYGSFDEIGEKPFTDPETGDRVVPDPFLRFAFHRLDTRIKQRLPRDGTATYALVFGLDQTGLQDLKTNEYRVAPRLTFSVPVSDTVTLGFGLDQEFQFFRLNNDLNDLEDVEADVEDLALLFSERFVSATGAWFDLAWKKGRMEVRPGIRADVYAQIGSSPYVPNATGVTQAFGVDPRLLLREKVHDRVTLRQSVGMYHQPPSFPIPIPGIESFGFERGLQRNIQGSFGYELTIIEGALSLVQDAYVGRLSNLQDYELGEAADEDPVDELEDVISQVTGWAYGLETLLRIDPQLRVYGWAAYTLSRATRDFPVGGNAPSNWDQRHIFNVVLGYRISQKWEVGARVHYHTGRPWTAPVDMQTPLEALTNNRNNARLPAFFQVDVRAERIWRWPNWQLSAILDLANATYSREVFQCSGDAEDGTPDSFIPRRAMLAAQINPSRGIAQCTPAGFRYIIPSLGLRARF